MKLKQKIQPEINFQTKWCLYGVDVSSALNIWIRQDIYKKTLIDFTNRHEQDIEKFTQALSDYDLDKARDIINSLKAICSNLCISKMAILCFESEKLLDNKKLSYIDLRQLKEELYRVILSIKLQFGLHNRTLTPLQSKNNNKTNSSDDLILLKNYLNEGDFTSAENIINKLKATASENDQKILNQIETHLMDFAFEQAIMLIKDLENKLSN